MRKEQMRNKDEERGMRTRREKVQKGQLGGYKFFGIRVDLQD